MTRFTTTTAHLSRPGAATKLVRSSRRRAFSGAVLAAAVFSGSLLSGSLVAGVASEAAAAGTTPTVLGVHGAVNLTIWSIDSDGPDFQAILSGAVGDYGPAVTVLPDGKVDPEHTSEMELDLRHGTFRLYIDGIVSKLRAQTAHEPVYAATCSDYFHVGGAVPIVAGSGTGSYRGIGGRFSLTLTGNENQKTPPCGPPFVRQILVMIGSGTVSS
jgi:hypothetical protein